jgi:hypothetical protein
VDETLDRGLCRAVCIENLLCVVSVDVVHAAIRKPLFTPTMTVRTPSGKVAMVRLDGVHAHMLPSLIQNTFSAIHRQSPVARGNHVSQMEESKITVATSAGFYGSL